MFTIKTMQQENEPFYCLTQSEIEILARQAGQAAATETFNLMRTHKEELITPKMAAKLLGVSNNTVRSWLHNGILKANRIGCHYFIPESEIHRCAKTRLETANLQPSADISARGSEKISPKS